MIDVAFVFEIHKDRDLVDLDKYGAVLGYRIEPHVVYDLKPEHSGSHVEASGTQKVWPCEKVFPLSEDRVREYVHLIVE